MTTTDVQLSLRPSRAARLYLTVFPVVFVLVVVLAIRPPLGWPFVVPFCAAAVAVSWRQASLRATGDADGRLVVRNHWRTRTLTRDGIVRVVDSVPQRWGARAVHLDLSDGSRLRIDATETPAVPWALPRLEQQAADVEEWRSGRSRPFL